MYVSPVQPPVAHARVLLLQVNEMPMGTLRKFEVQPFAQMGIIWILVLAGHKVS